MAYSENSLNRIIELIKEIKGRKEHENAATTYKDVPALQEIDKIAKEEMASEQPWDDDTLGNSIFVARYIGSAYESMWRIVLANKYYKQLFDLHLEFYRRFGDVDEELADDYYTALRARNYYCKDECTDLVEIAKELLPDEKRLDIEKRVLEDFHPLKHDPVELSDEYLAVIDEVERRMDTDEYRNAHPFIRSDRKKELLLEYGVKWKPVTALNPGYRFN